MGLNGLDFLLKSILILLIYNVLTAQKSESRPLGSVRRQDILKDDEIKDLAIWGSSKLSHGPPTPQSRTHLQQSALKIVNNDKSHFLLSLPGSDKKVILFKSKDGSKRVVVSSQPEEGELIVTEYSDPIPGQTLNDALSEDWNKGGIQTTEKNIPQEYLLKVTFNNASAWRESTVTEFKASIADLLGVPFHHVQTRLQLTSDKVLEMYIVKPTRPLLATPAQDLIPAQTIVAKLVNSDLALSLQQSTKLDVKALTLKNGAVVETYSKPWRLWYQPWFPYVAAAVCALFVCIILAMVCCCVRWRRKKNELSHHQHQLHRRQQLTLYPLSKPDLARTITTIQPDAGPYYLSQSAPVPANAPVRLRTNGRAKGLLESRRGSSASLTIDLTPMMEGKCGSPPKESPSREFLLSAGNRMTRKQLRKCMKNIKSLYDEFWEIPMNHPTRVSVPGVGIKNRYKTILPNDHSRIRLEEIYGDPSSTYINANYIRGYAGEPRAYIATQGCMSNTINDLWRMIWDEQAPCVVMITKLAEKDRVKCEEYFPLDTQCECYGEIEVSVASIQQRDGYEIRLLKVRHMKYVNEERNVLHFWFTSWPDHKTPDTPKQLLDMVREVELKRFIPGRRDKPKGPVIVHCSAGIGRTGCFIGISIGIRQMQEEQMIDVLGIVCQMRLDRGGMVQNNEQYEFVHRALSMYEKIMPQQSPSGD